MAVLTTPGLTQSIRNGWSIALLAYVNHPDGAVRVWNGVGDLDYDGNTWDGVGTLGSVKNIGGTRQLAIRRITFELRGLPADSLQWLNADIRNVTAQAWIAGLAADGTKVNGTAWQIVDGLADYQELPIGDDGSVTIRLHITEPVFRMEQPQDLAFTPEWLKSTRDEDATGLDLISTLANASKNWTRI